jgi:hypothetical protein
LGTLTCAGLLVEETPLVKLMGVSATFAPDKFLVEACPTVSAGVDYVKKSFRQLLRVEGYAEPAADLDLTSDSVSQCQVCRLRLARPEVPGLFIHAACGPLAIRPAPTTASVFD